MNKQKRNKRIMMMKKIRNRIGNPRCLKTKKGMINQRRRKREIKIKNETTFRYLKDRFIYKVNIINKIN